MSRQFVAPDSVTCLRRRSSTASERKWYPQMLDHSDMGEYGSEQEHRPSKFERTYTDVIEDELYQPSFGYPRFPGSNAPIYFKTSYSGRDRNLSSSSLLSADSECDTIGGLKVASNEHLKVASTEHPVKDTIEPIDSRRTPHSLTASVSARDVFSSSQSKASPENFQCASPSCSSYSTESRTTSSARSVPLGEHDPGLHSSYRINAFEVRERDAGGTTSALIPFQGQQPVGDVDIDVTVEDDSTSIEATSASESFCTDESIMSGPSDTDYAETTLNSPFQVKRRASSRLIHICTTCGGNFGSTRTLQMHRRSDHHTSSLPRVSHKKKTIAGGHRCHLINPSTGRICNSVFSRSYDLIRHEATIHSTGDHTFRCDLCAEKTFSRRDALTRHRRVKHNLRR